MDTSLKSSTFIHHLPSTHTTIVDVLGGTNNKDLLPYVSQDTKLSWPLLMCDHMGKMSIALVPSDKSEPTILPLESPHSETLRAAVAYRSEVYTCGDDGRLVRWQPSSTTNETVQNQQKTTSKKKSNSKKPY
jgi:hypothetical protein